MGGFSLSLTVFGHPAYSRGRRLVYTYIHSELCKLYTRDFYANVRRTVRYGPDTSLDSRVARSFVLPFLCIAILMRAKSVCIRVFVCCHNSAEWQSVPDKLIPKIVVQIRMAWFCFLCVRNRTRSSAVAETVRVTIRSVMAVDLLTLTLITNMTYSSFISLAELSLAYVEFCIQLCCVSQYAKLFRKQTWWITSNQ